MRIKFLVKISPKSPVVHNGETPTRVQMHRIRSLIISRRMLSMFVLFALTVLVVPVHAEPVQINMRAPFELLTVNACTGEEVMITGETHLLGHLVEAKGGSVHIRAMSRLQGT